MSSSRRKADRTRRRSLPLVWLFASVLILVCGLWLVMQRPALAPHNVAPPLPTQYSALSTSSPFLPPVKAEEGFGGAVYDQTGNFRWQQGKKTDPNEKITAKATRLERTWSKELKGHYDSDYPAGTIKREASMQLSGWPALGHEDYLIPTGAKAEKRWDYNQISLPDGSTLIGNSLCCQAGNRNFSPWSFLNLYGKFPGGTKEEPLFKPAICISANSFDGKGWASSELVFERPVSATATMRFFVRIKRVAGDPFLHMLVLIDPAGAAVESLDIHGYPNSPHPIVYGLVPQFPYNCTFVERERWVWLAGTDLNLHDKQKHVVDLASGSPLPREGEGLGVRGPQTGAFWYNRLNSETGGMQMVFLPEEISSARADGTYSVSVRLNLKAKAVRLSLLDWSDWKGWEAARQTFIADLPARMKTLRELSFAWPIEDALSNSLRAQTEALLKSSSLPESGRNALRTALDQYAVALSKLRQIPVKDTADRFAAEGEVLVLKGKVEDAIKPLLSAWVKAGGQWQ
ncbi:MAG TPA: hypothetical protein VGP72_30170 [Planctomycetota bacterium]|jgi:hypothetical protein